MSKHSALIAGAALLAASATPALANCTFDDDAFQNRIISGEVRKKPFQPVVKDLRTLRGALTILGKYDKQGACAEVVEAMEELANNPPQELARMPVADAGGKLSVQTVLDAEIRGAGNSYIGHVEDVVLDANGAPAYVIVEYGGFLGIGEEQAAIPFKSLEVTPDQSAIFLPLSEEQFADAPRFNRSSVNWMSDKTWQRGVDTYYAKSLKKSD
ncbi:MAG: PRC-barrel domain-containing protein [Pseudomonadota bacterium]